jgi:hypothetical protein
MLRPPDIRDRALPPTTSVDTRQQPTQAPIRAKTPIMTAGRLLIPRLCSLFIVGASSLALLCYRLVQLVEPGEDLALVGF